MRRVVGPQVILAAHVEGDCTVRASENQIRQVLLNLVLNARDAMPGGGAINVHISKSFAIVDPTSECPEDVVRMLVCDTGSGISPDVIDNIFEPFFTTKINAHGSGLGLAMVRTIVTELGGRISVESDRGAGSTFEVILPAASQAIEPNAGGIHCKEVPTVLIIDEQESVRETLHQYFEHQGYNLLAAASPGEALALSEMYEGTIAVVVTDSAESAAAISASRPDAHILLAAAPPYKFANDRLSFVPKPYSKHELLVSVQKLLLDPSA